MHSEPRNSGASNIVVFRNSKIWIAVILVFGTAAVLIGIGMGVATCVEMLPFRGYDLNRVLSICGWAAGGFFQGVLGIQLWKLALSVRYYQALLDSQGVHFRLGSRKKPQDTSFAWDQIAAIEHKQIPNNQYIAVIAKDGRSLGYTAYTFFRYKKLARAIAARAGLAIQELQPQKQ